jgi:phosphoribosylglycinamide formyltransferase-1
LLPAFPGVNAIAQAYNYGVKLTGVTVHFVDGGLDSGPVIAQRAIPVSDEDTESTLTGRIHALEHALLPEAIRWYREGRIRLDERKVYVN